jgi:hypothetical protein
MFDVKSIVVSMWDWKYFYNSDVHDMREGVNLHQQMCVFLPMLQIFIFTSFWLGFFWGEGGGFFWGGEYILCFTIYCIAMIYRIRREIQKLSTCSITYKI